MIPLHIRTSDGRPPTREQVEELMKFINESLPQDSTRTIEANVASRKAAEQLFQTMIDCVRDDYRRLDQHGKRIFVTMAYEKFKSYVDPTVQQMKTAPETKPPEVPQSERVRDALELCDDILYLAVEVPEEGEEFASSVSESCREVQETIERTNRVTDKQFEALENWLQGLRAWVRN